MKKQLFNKSSAYLKHLCNNYECERIDATIKGFNKLGIKSAISKAIAKNNDFIFVNNKPISREQKKLSAPKSRYIAKVKNEFKGSYVINQNLWRIEQKPIEWIRLNQSSVNNMKLLKIMGSSNYKRTNPQI